jgi:hypothetical protein
VEEVEVSDLNDDGIMDLTIRAGGVATEGAGPQRSMQRVYTWTGLFFTVRETSEESGYLFHAIVDADTAFAAARYDEAQRLYEAAIANDELLDWKAEVGQPPGAPELIPYALFRASLAALREGDAAATLALLEQVSDHHRASLHGQAALIYLDALLRGSSEADACSETELFLQSRSAEFAAIWDYGFSNPEHTIGTFCR